MSNRPNLRESPKNPPTHGVAMIFYPAIALMNHLGYAKKFALLGLMSIIAIGVVAYSLVNSLDYQIRTSQRLLEGVELIKPFTRILQLMQQHRGLSAGILAGDNTLRDQRSANEVAVTEALDGLAGILPPRLLSSYDLTHIKANWERIRKEGLIWTATENFAAHTNLIDELRIFGVAAADVHALTLVPEIDTFYLADTIISTLPHVLENLAQIRGYGTSLLAGKQATEQQKIKMNTLIADLTDNLGDLRTHLKASASHNSLVQESVSVAFNTLTDSAKQISDLVAGDIVAGRFTLRPSDFFAMTTASIDRGYAQLYEMLIPQIEAMLKANIAQTENKLRTSIGIAFLMFLGMVYFSIGISYAMISNIKSLARSAHAFAQGDIGSRIHLGTRDELSQVGDSFNEMADGFGTLLEARREDDARLHITIETAMDAVVRMNAEGAITGWNSQAEKIFGWSRDEALGRALSETIIPPRYREAHVRGLAHFLLTGEASVLNSRIEIAGLHRDGHELPLELAIATTQIEGKHEFSAFIRDITERKKAEQQLRESETRYKRIIEGLTDYQYTVRLENGRAVETLHSPGCVEVTGYTTEDFAADPYLWIQLVAPEDRDRVREYAQQVLAGNDLPPIEYRIIRKDRETRWVSDTTILLKDISGNLQSYDGVIKDITERKAAEVQIQHYVAQLEGAFMRTVEVTVTLTEMRDPYTAAHERRVAELAAAIGSELGLDARRLEGLRVAGQLHDVGKIGLPAEILAKPGRITAAEYTLIKEHAKAGYDALKDVGFPWPVADVAWQHHERIDGSGYPRGLKGDEILLEARIMSVADVVEAMASHRPYRPGLGIDKALEEIERGSGFAYDIAAAEACLRLFREKGYTLPS